VHEFSCVSSTSLIAANLPAWHVVRADVQTAGRGRFLRSWISDAGGLWLSAVVPCPTNSSARQALPLAVGLAVCDAFRELAVKSLRMRWPNDILVNDRKLAGLLLDRFNPSLIVTGIGINIHNRPEALDPSLKDQIARLADLLQSVPCPAELMAIILPHLRRIVQELDAFGLGRLLPRINSLWGPSRLVGLDLAGETRRGLFTQVDSEGRLLLADESGQLAAYTPSQVSHLTEL